MASHLEPTEVRGFLTVGEPREIGGVTLLLTATMDPRKFFLRITGHTEQMLAAKRVRHRRGRLVDKTAEPT